MDFIEKKIKELNKEFGDEVISSYWWRLIARFSEFLTQALQDHTADNIEQAIERAGTKDGNKGRDAAMSAIEMVNLCEKI